MITFVHIGLPKTLSSALQREFFPHHPSIHYLGIGQGGAIEWIDSDIQLIFDDLLVYARDGYWQSRRDWAKEVVARQLSQAGKAGKKAVGLSSEWLSVTLSPDMIDNRVKVERLLDLFGEEVRVIYFLRNQFDLLKSLYGQYVREGLALTFESFLDYIHDFRDRSIFFELCYETTVRQFSEAFGRSRVSAIPIERFKETSGELRTDDQGRICLVDEMCRVLKIEYPAGFCLPKVNPSLSDIELYHKFSLNREYPHDFGRG